LLDLTVRVDALRPLGGERDHTILVGDLDCLLLLNVEYLAGLRGADSLRFEHQLHADAASFDRVATLEFGGLDRFGAFDLESSGFPFRADALRSYRFFLGNARRLDRLA